MLTATSDRPFIQHEQLAPVSESTNSRSASPRTPPYPNHNNTEVSDEENNSVVEVQPDGHVPFIGDGKTQHLPAPQQYAPADPRYAPVSARSVAGSGLLDKMKTIAPGPFDVRTQGRPKLEAKASSEDVLGALPTAGNMEGHHSRSSTQSSLRSQSSKASTASSNYTIAALPAKPVINNPGGYKAFSPGLQTSFDEGEPSPREMLGAGNRSQTFPNLPTQQSFGLPRRPSESAGLNRPSNVKLDNNEELDGKTFVRTSPPREAGRRAPSMNGKPPPRGKSFTHGRDISAVNLAAEFGASNPYHTSTISQSSDGSNESRTSKISSRSSPPSSIDAHAWRKPSVTAGLNGATNGLQQAVNQARPVPKPQPLSPPPPPVISSRTVMTPPKLDVSLLAPESPMDPANIGGRLSPMPDQAFPPHVRGPSGPPPMRPQPPSQGRESSQTPLGSQQCALPSQQQQHRLPNRGPAPPGGPHHGLPARPNAPLMQQNGFPAPRRPSQNGPPPMNGNRGPPPSQQPPQQYKAYRSPTSSTFPSISQQPHPDQRGPPRRPSQANLPSPHHEFPQGQGPHRRPSHTNLPSTYLPSPGGHLTSPGGDPHQRRTPGSDTPTGSRPPHGQDGYFPGTDRRPSQHSTNPQQNIRPLQPPPIPSSDPERRPTTSSSQRSINKGDCKWCGKAITGKSVSSADGRLTGRYHKECFVCRTCQNPFPSAEFYVIRDAPYCEEHYHRLNNSVCASRECGRGIEGQFLETERKQKFHPNCLRCNSCWEVLKGDYYEVRGGVFCERDALRQQQRGGMRGRGGGLMPGMSRLEKRSTRLMMM